MRGAWIEILATWCSQIFIVSLPVRGAWIEIDYPTDKASINSSLPVRGAWIEIDIVTLITNVGFRRSPCGERGLKSTSCESLAMNIMSLPVRGAWIEMTNNRRLYHRASSVAPRAGSVD